MAKTNLQVNSHRFLGTHFHVVNELTRFLENAGNPKNATHSFIVIATPLLFAVVAMNDSFLRFTSNETLIETLKEISQYSRELTILLDEVYPECNEENHDKAFYDLKNEAEKIYKKTVSDLNNAVATNFIEKLHIKHLIITLTSLRSLALLKMQYDDCNKLTPLICDLDLTTKMFLKRMEKIMRS